MLRASLPLASLLVWFVLIQEFQKFFVISEILKDKYKENVNYNPSRSNYTQQTNKNWQIHNNDENKQEIDYVIQSNIVKLRVSIRNPSVLHNVPSCQYTISQIELLSLVSILSSDYTWKVLINFCS